MLSTSDFVPNFNPGFAADFAGATISPLMLADRLLSLAEDATRAGLHRPAERLLRLAYSVYDEKPVQA